jgi:hypothetical protein
MQINKLYRGDQTFTDFGNDWWIIFVLSIRTREEFGGCYCLRLASPSPNFRLTLKITA